MNNLKEAIELAKANYPEPDLEKNPLFIIYAYVLICTKELHNTQYDVARDELAWHQVDGIFVLRSLPLYFERYKEDSEVTKYLEDALKPDATVTDKDIVDFTYMSMQRALYF